MNDDLPEAIGRQRGLNGTGDITTAEGARAGSGMLRELRLLNGLTQEGLAHIAGLHVRTIRGLESGRITTPRRSSMDLLASALGLDVTRHLTLLAAWGIHDATPGMSHPAPPKVTRTGIIEAALAQSEARLRTVALNERAVIGEDRRTARRTTHEVVAALVDGVSSRYVYYDAAAHQVDVDHLHLTGLENCVVEREVRDPDGWAKLFELRLPQPLRQGETQVLHYAADFAAARTSRPTILTAVGEEIARFPRSPASYVLEVGFHESAPPSECAQVFQPRPAGPVRQVTRLPLTSSHAVHIALLNPRPGGHGISWQWDD